MRPTAKASASTYTSSMPIACGERSCYYAFDTPEVLDKMRAEAEAQGGIYI